MRLLNKLQSSLCILGLLLAGSVCAADVPTPAPAPVTMAAPLVPLESFFLNPTFARAQFSPNGREIAFLLSSTTTHARLVVLNLATMKPTIVGSFNDIDIGQFSWVNDHRLVYSLRTSDFGPGLFAVNDDGTESRRLAETQTAWAKTPDQGRKILPWNTFQFGSIGQADTNETFVLIPEVISLKKIDYIKLNRLNTVTGQTKEVEAPLHAVHWLDDDKGELRSVTTHVGHVNAVFIRKGEDNTWAKISEFDGINDVGIKPVLWQDSGKLLVAANPEKNFQSIYEYDTSTQKLADKPMLTVPGYDVNPQFIVQRGHLLGVRYSTDGEVTQWLDDGMKTLQSRLDKRLPKTSNRIVVPPRPELDYVIVESHSDVQPTMTLLYDTKTDKLSRLGVEFAAIVPANMAKTDMIHYKARDGREIPAYLTVPAHADQAKLPLIVFVHGGPWARDGGGHWNPDVQFLASRGYAVIQPEFRGSTGFGFEHYKAGWKQWGLTMQDDVADAAHWTIDQGIADPKRICIAGASYGGYATMMGLGKNPELFRCGINWVGVTDIQMLFDVGWSDFSDSLKEFDLPILVGDPVKDAEQFKATSPLQNASKIKQPVLMAYGHDDVRVPKVHGERMKRALSDNPNVEWVVYDKEGHGWFKPETRLDFWGRVEKFLQKNLAEAPSK